MVVDVQALKGVNSHIASISLNADPARKGEAGTIEDGNQEHQNNLKTFNWQGQQWPCFLYVRTFDSYVSKILTVGSEHVISFF